MDSDIKPVARSIRRPSLVLGIVLGGLTSLPVIALAYLGSKWIDLPFFPFDLFDWLARVLPGNVITVGIDSMVRLIQGLGLGPISATAKSFEQGTGVVIVVAAGAVLGFLLVLQVRRGGSGNTLGSVLGIVGFLLMAAIEVSLKGTSSGNMMFGLLWLAILIISWGALLGNWLTPKGLSDGSDAEAQAYDASRRATLIKLAGGSIALAVVATGLGRLLEAQKQASGAGQALLNFPAPQPGINPPSAAPTVAQAPTAAPTGSAAAEAATPVPPRTAVAALPQRVAAAPGTRAELTATEDFYRIDIDTLPEVIDKNSWQLQVSGLFDHPRPLTLSDLMAYPAVTQPITQGCISNPVGGDLIGTANYTGVRLSDLLKDLGLKPAARALAIQGSDGFYESVNMHDILDPRTLLVYGMNGSTLPNEHGFPLRIYIPNRYGMKQPKWITAMQATDSDGPGYWVDRGWSPTAYPQIVSVIDTVAKDHIENGSVPVGGIAWAGDRGIKKIEVQVDQGPWTEATLRTPPLSPLTWVQWVYAWPVVKGNHTFRVRATDGTGAAQVGAVADTYPDGATGYHSVTVTI